MNHPKLFIEIAGLHFCEHIFVLIVKHVVLLYEVSLRKFNHFKRDQKTNRNEVHEQDEPDYNRNPAVFGK